MMELHAGGDEFWKFLRKIPFNFNRIKDRLAHFGSVDVDHGRHSKNLGRVCDGSIEKRNEKD